jgi:hypothetical protein
MNLLRSSGLKFIALVLLHFAKNFTGNMASPSKYLWVPVLTTLQLYGIGRKTPRLRPESFSVILVIILLASLEGTIHYYFNHPFRVSPRLTGILQRLYNISEYQTLSAKPEAAVYDPVVFYTLAPEVNYTLSSREYSFSIHTNRLGLRDQDSNLVRPEAIFLGDSFVMGYGVAQDSALPQRMARLTGLRTLNAGIPSYGTARESQLLNRLDTSALKWLFIQYCSNDESENELYVRNGFSLDLPRPEYFRQMQEIEKWKVKYFPGKFTGLILNLAKKGWHETAQARRQDEYKLRADISRPAIRNFLEIINRLPVNFDRTRVVVVHLDANLTGEDPFIAECRNMALGSQPVLKNLSKVSFLDLNTSQEKGDYFYFDWHLRESGQRHAAESLATWMREAR